MVLTVTEDTPADMLAGSMELLVQLPREHHLHTQRVTVQRSTPMMDLLVQIATAHKLAASNYTLQAIGERGLILPHQPNTPIGALDALQVKLLPKQCTFVPKKVKHANQPFETTFRLQVHLPRNQLYVSRVSPKMNLGEILNEVCREKNLDKHKYELRHPVNLEEILDLNLSLQDYHLQEVTLYAKQGRTLGSALSSQDIMALQRQEERRRQQAKQSVFGFMFKKSKESSVSTDSLEGRSVSPARSDETGRSASPLQPPTRPQRKRRLAPKPPPPPPSSSSSLVSSNQETRQNQQVATTNNTIAEGSNKTTKSTTNVVESSKEKMLIGHSRNSSDSSGYHEASVLSDNPDTSGRLPETLPRRNKAPGTNETPRKLVHTSQSSKSLGNLAVTASGTSLDRALSSSSLSSTGLKKKRAAPPPPAAVSRPLSSAISTQALERIDDSEESLTSDMDPSKPPSDIGVPSKASSDIGVSTIIIEKSEHSGNTKNDQNSILISDVKLIQDSPVDVEHARVDVKRDGDRKLCDTDMLLHKVSETLSSSSSLTSSNEEEIDQVYSLVKTKNENCREELIKDNDEIKNQQDTSDYVSALEEDSSIVDWEYQLPAPPSAFRDNDSQILDGYETVTLRSVDAFKETICENRDDTKNESSNVNRIDDIENKSTTIDNNRCKSMETHKNKLEQKCNKKEMIMELENKIEKGGTLSKSIKETDSRKVLNNNSKISSNVAPIDNTLSNFTITTYTREKSIDIFKDEKDNNNSQELVDETSRNTKIQPKISNKISNKNDESKTDIVVQRSKSHASAICKTNWKNEMEDNRAMIDVKIAKSDNSVSLSDNNDLKEIADGNNKSVTETARKNDKFSQWRENMLKRQEEPTKEKQLQSLQVLKSILPQLTNSQPAEENVSKERNSNVGFREKLRNRFETESNENSNGKTPSVFSNSHGESHVTAKDENKNNTVQKEGDTTKRRYIYNGPPAINLGSWSERPSVKVQIKMDTDYKLGRGGGGDQFVNNNATIITIPSNVKEQTKEIREKREPDDSTTKFSTHATASGFKKLTSNKIKTEERPIVTSVELKKTTNVVDEENSEETRRSKNIRDKDNEKLIDTTPLNFQELTKTFRLDIDQRIKPQRSNANRHSEYYGSQQELIRKSIEINKQNGHANEFPITKKNIFQKNATSNNENHNHNFVSTDKKQFTSVIGINSYNNRNHHHHHHHQNVVQKNNNVSLKNNVNNIKVHPISAPVVKGFKVSTTIPFQESKISKIDKTNENKDVVDGQAPKAPTMPVIMGVTLKSANARPKSMPINVDSRDMLLDSIRNFGGRGNLKNAAERY